MGSIDIEHSLKQSPLFSCLADEQLKHVSQHSKYTNVNEGQVLFSQGDPVDNFYLVISGRIKLYRLSADGQEKIIEIVNPGNTFGEALIFLDHSHYPVCASALKDSELIAINGQQFATMLRGSIDACFLLMGNMSQRLRGMVHEIDELSLHSGTCRIASYLLNNAPVDQDSYTLDVPKSVIAARLSVKPETFSRIIKNLSKEQIISVNGNQITIHNRDALTRIGLV